MAQVSSLNATFLSLTEGVGVLGVCPRLHHDQPARCVLERIERQENDNGKSGKGSGNQIPATVRQTAIGIAESAITLLAVAKQAEI